MQCLRTPDQRFENLTGYDFEPHYIQVPDQDGGTLRIHTIDEGPKNGEVIVCLHGQPSWSYLYRKMIPHFVTAGYRVIAPDLVGFGRSDKPTEVTDYTYSRHVAWISVLFEQFDLQNVTLFCQDWGGLIGLRVVAAMPERFARVVASNTALPDGKEIPEHMAAELQAAADSVPVQPFLEVGRKMKDAGALGFLFWRKYCAESPDFNIGDVMQISSRGTMSANVRQAYEAPFPNQSYMAGARQFPLLVPIIPGDPEMIKNRAAWEALSNFDRPFMTAFSDGDPITRGHHKKMQKLIKGAQGVEHVTIEDAGHFLQEEKPEELAKTVIRFMAAHPRLGLSD
jgi:haloalkane dehalogenase